MDDAEFERHGALTGVGFVVLLVVAVALAGSGTRPSDSAEEVASYLADKESQLKIGAYVTGLSTALFLWFVGALGRGLRTVSARLATVAVASGVAAAVFFGAALAITYALVQSVDNQVDGVTLEYLGTLSRVLVGLAAFAAGSLAVAVALTVIRWRVLPSWVSALALVTAAAQLVAGVAVSDQSDGMVAFGYGALFIFLILVLALAVTMYQRGALAAGRT
jgi:hypothetical protein